MKDAMKIAMKDTIKGAIKDTMKDAMKNTMKVSQKEKSKNFILQKLLIVLFWLIVWQILSRVIDNAILLEGPIEVVKRLIDDLQTKDYYHTVGASLLRMNAGLVLGILLAVLLSICAWKQKILEELFAPLVQFLKTAPIACFIVLLLIWTGSKNLAFYVALLVAFPPVYLNLVEGFKHIPKEQMELAKVYCMPLKNRMKYIYLPSIKPYFMSALSLSVGMAFKAGVAAEIIGTPDFSMGERIYMSKIYLDTAGVLSWMITVIVASYICEKIFGFLANAFFHRKFQNAPSKKKEKICARSEIVLENVYVAFDGQIVLENVTKTFEVGKIYCLVGESGVGKTTLFRTLLGLEKLDSGEIKKNAGVMATVFQESRLFEEYTAAENVLATGQCFMTKTKVEEALREILPIDALSKPLREYSGGMKRRVEIARAMLSVGDTILLDEPFNGLDKESKEKTIAFIKKYQNDRTILFTSHHLEDIKLMGGEEIDLWKNEWP